MMEDDQMDLEYELTSMKKGMEDDKVFMNVNFDRVRRPVTYALGDIVVKIGF
jgi:hypothetical protein